MKGSVHGILHRLHHAKIFFLHMSIVPRMRNPDLYENVCRSRKREKA
jgi:hypothetical protein